MDAKIDIEKAIAYLLIQEYQMRVEISLSFEEWLKERDMLFKEEFPEDYCPVREDIDNMDCFICAHWQNQERGCDGCSKGFKSTEE